MEASDMTGAKKESLEVIDVKVGEIIMKLPRVKNPIADDHIFDSYLYLYQGFWVPDILLEGVISFQKNFEAQDGDVLLASCPKSGTTWLKALAFTIMNRTHFVHLSCNPLTATNPHNLVPFVGLAAIHTPHELQNAKPRLYSTHVPYSSLPPSIKSSNCKIVCICRNPFDSFVSHWHFVAKFFGENVEPKRLEDNFDAYFHGIHAFGPFWDHHLGYWKANMETPLNKILFLKYEDLKKDAAFWVKKLADFLGFPFSAEEEKQGAVEEIVKLCSFDNMKSLEINKNGRSPIGVSNSAFFRKGEVGNWVNYLTPQMIESVKNLIHEKYSESMLSFDFEPILV